MTSPRDHLQNKLKTLLLQTTATRKHSAYQILPVRLAKYIGLHGAIIKPKYEAERFAYITSKLDLKGKTALDIGSNTGYFTFELLDAGCTEVTAYEGGSIHSQFLQLAARALGDEKRVVVQPEYFDFQLTMPRRDIALLLNVVHHAGDDYGDQTANREDAKSLMLHHINNMSRYSDVLVFQMGFNWKGDISRCLFEKGTKAEMIDFVSAGTMANWTIDHIGVAEKQAGAIRYEDVNETNVCRDDSLGEFLNRPIFIMHAN